MLELLFRNKKKKVRGICRGLNAEEQSQNHGLLTTCKASWNELELIFTRSNQWYELYIVVLILIAEFTRFQHEIINRDVSFICYCGDVVRVAWSESDKQQVKVQKLCVISTTSATAGHRGEHKGMGAVEECQGPAS